MCNKIRRIFWHDDIGWDDGRVRSKARCRSEVMSISLSGAGCDVSSAMVLKRREGFGGGRMFYFSSSVAITRSYVIFCKIVYKLSRNYPDSVQKESRNFFSIESVLVVNDALLP